MKMLVALGLLVVGCSGSKVGPFLPPPGHFNGVPGGGIRGSTSGSGDASSDAAGPADAGAGNGTDGP